MQVWMCGGSVEVVPCSHVGHLFRHRAAHNFIGSSNSRKNYLRVAEVWLDEYKDHFYQKIGVRHSRDAAVGFLVAVVFLLCFFWIVRSRLHFQLGYCRYLKHVNFYHSQWLTVQSRIQLKQWIIHATSMLLQSFQPLCTLSSSTPDCSLL